MTDDKNYEPLGIIFIALGVGMSLALGISIGAPFFAVGIPFAGAGVYFLTHKDGE